MKVMISLPMNGRKKEEVEKRLKELTAEFKKMHIDVVHSFDTKEIKVDSNNPRVFYLGRTIMKYMHDVDAVYFDKGWNDAKGCKIERAICREYGIKILDTDFLSRDDSTILHITTSGNGGFAYYNDNIKSYCDNDVSNTRRYANEHISYREGSNG
jgi:hypothetical protein